MQSENPSNKLNILKIYIILFCILGHVSVFAVGISGKQSALVLITRNPNAPVSYSNKGYCIDSKSNGLAHVSVDARPLRYTHLYPCDITNPEACEVLKSAEELMDNSLPEPIIRQAKTLSQNSRDYYHAVDCALNWVSEHFNYSDKKESLLTGNCVDAARLTVSFMAVMGIPARVATGVMMDSERKVVAGAALHTVVEIYYPDMGWMFSDPLATHHFVSAEFVYLGKTPFSDYLGVVFERKKVVDNYRIIDILNNRVSIRKRVNLFRY